VRIVLALDGGTGARVQGDIALGHEPLHPDGLRSGDQVVRALGPQAVGRREIALHVTRVDRSDRRQLVDDHVRPCRGHRPRDLIGLERVRDDRYRAELVKHRLLRLAPRHPMDLMTAPIRRGTSCLTIAPVAPATNTLITGSLIEDCPALPRRAGNPRCDSEPASVLVVRMRGVPVLSPSPPGRLAS
jgi:hypothetical protein